MDNQSGTIKIEGFDELQKKLTIVLPSLIRQMAFTSDASAAALARKEEESYANQLEMGKPQTKSYQGRVMDTAIHTKWSSSTGWVSNKMTKGSKGNPSHPWQMAHFGWARGTRARKGSVIAEYGSILANLWARPTKPYTGASPLVGQVGKKLKRWARGEVRPARYSWSITSSIISSMADAAVAKTEKQFAKQFKEM